MLEMKKYVWGVTYVTLEDGSLRVSGDWWAMETFLTIEPGDEIYLRAFCSYQEVKVALVSYGDTEEPVAVCRPVSTTQARGA